MSINKVNYLDSNGVDKLLEEVFGTISDHYVRLESIDSELDSTSTNPVENRVIYSALSSLSSRLSTILSEGLQIPENMEPGQILTLGPNNTIQARWPEDVKSREVYEFTLDLSESDPYSNITYGGVNTNYTPAHMDYTNDVFDYGDWANAWFIRDCRPCMLKYDGTVDYYLEPYSYATRIDYDGNRTADIADDTYSGNVMIEIPTVWIQVSTEYDSDYSRPLSVTYTFASYQVNHTYHAYAHTNANGDVVPYIYISAYDAWKDSSNRLRSISGKSPTRSETGTNQITQCRANNLSGATIWDLHTLVDHELITLLLMLIGKSTNSQAVFGYGNGNGYNSHATGSDTYGVLSSGSMNNKGLFWGSNEDNLGVKVFGIEHFWGNIWKRTQGLINDNGTLKYKLTRGTDDGTTVNDYNTTGSGYLNGGSLTNITSGQFITDMYVGNFGFLPKATNTTTGSASTYYCDNVWVNNSQVNFALFGGSLGYGSLCGSFFCFLNAEVGDSYWDIGAALSCKPILS